jgi:formiminotetrahydrofolate cyclodeaminase
VAVETLLDGYLERLASRDPVPGGGSASALVGSIAAALVAMVGRIVATPTNRIVARADELRGELAAARVRDEAAYAAVVAAQALPKRDETERAARRRAIEAALHIAAEEPLLAAGLALEVLRLAGELLETDSRALASDIGCAAEFAHAALAGCAYNVRVNHRYMHDEDAIRAQAERLAAYESEAPGILERVRDAVRKALARP